MGLDMELRANVKGSNIERRWELFSIDPVHEWFVREVMNGKESMDYHLVSKEKLTELQTVCRKVLENPELAYTDLPVSKTRGRTRYGEDYIDKIENVLETIDFILENFKFEENKLYYTANW
ncbi:hypothetical protein COF68_06370 [Bacillus toyonensis]|uniref:hypothetical protein n=1 Tax=Bacillus toyonensis TaxID=155322 RepID=UPI000BFB50DE|nr:hypothetical protein [Bacillus toyonensis]PHE64459.1 hypothetical protein COF68_06370 [Bacillus toyonensis]